MDRREAIKKAAVAGTVVWTVPTLVSSRASAQEDTCTPKCVPLGTPAYTVLAVVDTCGRLYNVRVTVVPTAGSVSCPCGGTPTTQEAVLSRSFSRRFRGQADLTEDVELVCIDRSGSSCPITCAVTVTVNITGNNGNDCAQSGVTVVGVNTTC